MQNSKKALPRLLIYISLSILTANACGTSNDGNVVKEFNKKTDVVGVIIHENKALVDDINDLLRILVRKKEKQQFDDEFGIVLKQLFHKEGVYLGKSGKWQEELNRIKAFIETNENKLKKAGIDTESTIYTISMALIQIRNFEKLLNDMKFNN